MDVTDDMISEEVNITEEQIRECSLKLISKIEEDKFYPEVIIGLSRGGLIPAQYVAYGMDVKHIETISIQLRDDAGLKANEEINTLLDKLAKKFEKSNDKVNILVVDDLVDTGDTIKLVHAFFHHDKLNVRTAALYQNFLTPWNEIVERATYWGEEKPKGWLNFPWDTLTN